MLLGEEYYIKEGRERGIAEAISDLAKQQGLTVEQACEMCGYDEPKIIQILGAITAEAERAAAEAKARELARLTDYILEPIKGAGCPERYFTEPIAAPEQQEVARQNLIKLKERIAEAYDGLRCRLDHGKPHILQQHGLYGYRLIRFFVSLRRKDYEWACRVLYYEIARPFHIYDPRTALAVLKILETVFPDDCATDCEGADGSAEYLGYIPTQGYDPEVLKKICSKFDNHLNDLPETDWDDVIDMLIDVACQEIAIMYGVHPTIKRFVQPERYILFTPDKLESIKEHAKNAAREYRARNGYDPESGRLEGVDLDRWIYRKFSN